MNYEDLLQMCARSVGVMKLEGDVNLHHVVRLLTMQTDHVNRGMAAELLARFMVEYIEGQIKPVVGKPH